MLVSRSIYFGSSPAHRVIHQGKVSAPDGNYGTGTRVFKSFIYNDGTKDIVVTLDGAVADLGYGVDWTNRASVTVKAGGNATLAGCIRGTEEHFRLAVQSADGETSGRIEIFDESNNFLR